MDDSKAEAAKALKEKGNVAYKQGHLQQALSFYQEAAAAQPDHAVYLANCSAALYELGRYELAIPPPPWHHIHTRTGAGHTSEAQ